jgi:alkaline phosphatase D
MRLTRRGFLITSASSAAVATFSPGCLPDPPPFRHGVASGDPLSDRVILWTRVTPQGSPASVTVFWAIASDPAMSQIVMQSAVNAVPASDYTVKIDATGLLPGTTYYYQFHALGWASPVGRTKTFPVGEVERARFAVVSCINYPYGYFNGYACIARRSDIDAVICLGDYYYEYPNGAYDNVPGVGDGTPIDRAFPGGETVTLADYRTRHALYKTDLFLQEMHRQLPFISIWDDHEFADDAWMNGANNHQPGSEGAWVDRRAASMQAYYEWMPIRQVDPGNPLRVFRSFQYGNLLDLVMLDSRLFGRDEQASSFSDTATINDPARHIIGAAQETFLQNALATSQGRGAVWRLVSQQVIVSQVLLSIAQLPPVVFNTDQWDGYVPARERLFDIIDNGSIDNVVFLTGDVHTSWAMEVSRDPYDDEVYDPETSDGAIAVEFVGPAITSPGLEDETLAQTAEAAQYLIQPHLRFIDLFHRGYMIIDVTASRVQTDWFFTPLITHPNTSEFFAKGYQVNSGSNQLVEVFAPSMAQAAPQMAPDTLLGLWLRGEGRTKLDFA